MLSKLFASVLVAAFILPSILGGSIPDGPDQTFVATLLTVDNSTSKVYGTVAVFIGTNGSLAYTGNLFDAQPNLNAASCNATNGCGVHIHDGIGCASPSQYGGHFYEPPVTSDPWLSQKYSTDSTGEAQFCGQVVAGSTNVSGKPFIAHDSSGNVIACGVLSSPPASQIFEAEIAPFGLSFVSGTMTVYNPGKGTVFMYGNAVDLQPNLLSYMMGGTDCNATLGCGVHIHAGTSCATEALQGDHWYNSTALTMDPWLKVGYEQTNSKGDAQFCAAVTIDEASVAGHAAVIHSNNGTRVACGILEGSNSPSSSPGSNGTSKTSSSRPIYWTHVTMGSLLVTVTAACMF